MKILLLIFMFLLSCIGCLAEKSDIPLTKSCPEDIDKDKRSVVFIPTATIDANILCIYPGIPVNNLTLIIRDNTNNVVYSNDSMLNSQCHTFNLSSLPEGIFMLEFNVGDDTYCGYFSMERSEM